ncbi:MAG: signal peptidase I [bacterium]
MNFVQQNKKYTKTELELAKECLEKGAILYSGVKGWSMFPWINYSDKILIKKIPTEEIKVGDIIVVHYGEEEMFIGHRVIRIQQEIKGKSFLTKGDFVFFIDELVEEEKVIGKVREIIKKNGLKIDLENKRVKIFSYLTAKYSFAVAICISLLKRVCLISYFPLIIGKIGEIITIIPWVIIFGIYNMYSKISSKKLPYPTLLKNKREIL